VKHECETTKEYEKIKIEEFVIVISTNQLYKNVVCMYAIYFSIGEGKVGDFEAPFIADRNRSGGGDSSSSSSGGGDDI
jgi:hypothetical protein